MLFHRKKVVIKVEYCKVAEINEGWSLISLRKYYKCVDEISGMFWGRHPS